jgi:hypothetical protein
MTSLLATAALVPAEVPVLSAAPCWSWLARPSGAVGYLVFKGQALRVQDEHFEHENGMAGRLFRCVDSDRREILVSLNADGEMASTPNVPGFALAIVEAFNENDRHSALGEWLEAMALTADEQARKVPTAADRQRLIALELTPTETATFEAPF